MAMMANSISPVVSPQSIEQKNAGDIMEVFRLKIQLSGEAGPG